MTPFYGWRRSPPSPHDWPIGRLGALSETPEKSDGKFRLQGLLPLEQLRQDCTANAVARAIQRALGGHKQLLPSRDWIYYQSGVPLGEQRNDTGRYLRDTFVAIAHMGWPEETSWSYGKWPLHPGGEAHRNAFDQRGALGLEYYRLDTPGADVPSAIKLARTMGYPIVGGAPITRKFEQQDGTTPLEPDAGVMLGGHAFELLEYDEAGVDIENSWGLGFGHLGWGRLSWRWVAAYMFDLWAVRMVPLSKFPPRSP